MRNFKYIKVAISQAPVNPAEDDPGFLRCVMNAITFLGIDRIAGSAQWIADTVATVNRLVEWRQRCLAMTNETLRNICLTSWTAQVIFEANRIVGDLRALAGDEVARQLTL